MRHRGFGPWTCTAGRADLFGTSSRSCTLTRRLDDDVEGHLLLERADAVRRTTMDSRMTRLGSRNSLLTWQMGPVSSLALSRSIPPGPLWAAFRTANHFHGK